MALCGAGCMGFVNVARGLNAIGYTEPDPLPAGLVALVTHSGSVFSALLRSRRAIGFTLAVSSGQELVTAAPSYLEYAAGRPETRVLALVLEAMRRPDQLRQVLASAAERDLPVVLLTAGSSQRGRMMVAAHSGALAAADGGWEALARAYGVRRVRDLAELADTLEMFAIGRRARPGRRPRAAPTSRWWCSAASAARLTPSLPPGCGRRASPCWKACGPDCSRCVTCWITPARPAVPHPLPAVPTAQAHPAVTAALPQDRRASDPAQVGRRRRDSRDR